MSVVLVSFARLPAASLGCYGELNTRTPVFDRLASHCLVCDNYFISPVEESLPSRAGELSESSLLIHDGHLDLDVAGRWSSSLPLSLLSDPSAFSERLSSTSKSGTLTVGARLLGVTCKADPLDTEALSDALGAWMTWDPEVIAEPLARLRSCSRHALDDWELFDLLGSLTDWEQRLVLRTARAIRSDKLLGQILQALEPVLQQGDLLIVTGESGDARADSELRPDWLASVAETAVHLPLLVRQVGADAGDRFEGFLQTADMAGLIREALIEQQAEPSDRHRDLVARWLAATRRSETAYSSTSARAVRTRDWLFVQQTTGGEVPADGTAGDDFEEVPVRLFRKPEDVWETLDVSGLFVDLVEEFRQRLHQKQVGVT